MHSEGKEELLGGPHFTKVSWCWEAAGAQMCCFIPAKRVKKAAVNFFLVTTNFWPRSCRYKSSLAVFSRAVMNSSYFWFCQTFAAVLWFELPPPIFPLWGGIQGSHFPESQKLLFPQSVVPSKAGSKQGRSKWKATAKSVASITW